MGCRDFKSKITDIYILRLFLSWIPSDPIKGPYLQRKNIELSINSLVNTGRPGVLQFMRSQRVGHDWATELNWTEQLALNKIAKCRRPRVKKRWGPRTKTTWLLRVWEQQFLLPPGPLQTALPWPSCPQPKFRTPCHGWALSYQSGWGQFYSTRTGKLKRDSWQIPEAQDRVTAGRGRRRPAAG